MILKFFECNWKNYQNTSSILGNRLALTTKFKIITKNVNIEQQPNLTIRRK